MARGGMTYIKLKTYLYKDDMETIIISLPLLHMSKWNTMRIISGLSALVMIHQRLINCLQGVQIELITIIAVVLPNQPGRIILAGLTIILQSKYLIGFNFRYDGSPIFPEETQIWIFPRCFCRMVDFGRILYVRKRI